MALIGTIRKNIWFVFILLGLALVAFIMMDANLGGKGGAGDTTAMAVNGEKIGIQEFQRLESVESNTSGLSGNALRSKVYDDLIVRSIVTEEADNLGLGVPEEEMDNLLFGFNPSPIIQQWFVNPQTGQFDYQQLQQVKTALDAGDINPNFQAIWEEKTKQVKITRLQSKIATMVSKGIYTPNWMAEELSKTNSQQVSFDYVNVSPNTINDADVTVSDADYKAYMDANPSEFNADQESRIIEYVTYNIIPTEEDSMSVKQNLVDKIPNFLSAKNDSLFAIANGGASQNFYFKAEDLPEAFQDSIVNTQVGDIVGPLINTNYYTVLKVKDIAQIPDSAQASHILRSATPGNEASFTAASAYIDSIKTLFLNGTMSFDSLAINNSQDPGSAAQGGDLGYFTQGTMVPAFNDAVFYGSEVNGLYTVRTSFGIHLIYVKDLVYTTDEPKYKVAFINGKIVPSTETINNVRTKATEFVTNNRSLESMRNSAAENPEISINTSQRIEKTDYNFESFQYSDDSRNIIIWAFDSNTSVGDVAPKLFVFRNPTFGYESTLVIPALQAKIPKGTSRLADVKNSITPEVINYKKAQMISDQMKGKALEQIATEENVQVQTVQSASLASSAISQIGYEPSVVAALISGNEGEMVGPVVGNNGVYMIKINSKSTPNVGNTSMVKRSSMNNMRQAVRTQLQQAFRKGAEVEDNRMDFNM